MRLSTMTKTLRNGRARLLLRLLGLADQVYRAEFLAAASRSGMLRALGAGPLSLAQLMNELAIPGARSDEFRAWLRLGERLGEVSVEAGNVRLKGLLAKALVDPANDDLAAMIEQFARYRHVHRGLDLLRAGERIHVGDADATLVARASRLALPFVEEAVDRHLPRQAGARLLEIGCGSGHIMRHAAQLNPGLTLLGVELDDGVAKLARNNLESWGLGRRADVVVGDARSLTPDGKFDLITLHNNIYYFRVDERVVLFRHLAGLLAPGGKLLITTSCAGGNLGTEVLNLYWTFADMGGPLPAPEELTAQLREAGCDAVKAERLVPREAYHAFVATRGLPSAAN
jgi:SAM-dependent methyltransferase